MGNKNSRQAVEAQQNFSNTLRLGNRPKGGGKNNSNTIWYILTFIFIVIILRIITENH